MIIKKEFELLKGTKNLLNLSPAIIKANTIVGDRANLGRRIKVLDKRIKHYTSKKVFSLTTNLKEIRKNIHIVNIETYPLFISYNTTTKRIIFNLHPYGVDEISRIDEQALYAALVYGITFRELVTNKIKIKDIYFVPMTNWITTVFVQTFGKDYGLLGAYQSEINKLKFLIGCYVQASFFGITSTLAYRRAATVAQVDYKNIKDQLEKYDFSNINDFIKSLSELKVFPGFNKIKFTQKLLSFFGMNTLPALEDCSRFIATMMSSSISGSILIPTYIGKKYNRDEFAKILEIGKLIFK